MKQTNEWHVLKILLVSLVPFIGCWLFLQFLFEAFKLHLSAGFISTFLFVHVVISIIIYEIFRTLLRGKLTLHAIKIRFNTSMSIALTADVVIVALLSTIFNFDSIILLSPFLLSLVLFLSLRVSIPAGAKRRMKLRWEPTPVDFVSSDPTDEILRDMVDIRNPNGLTNPASPNYMERRPY